MNPSEKKQQLNDLLASVTGADTGAMRKAKEHVASLAAPPGSLGALSDIGVRLAGITGNVRNTLPKKRVLVFCADNGVVDEGVSVTPVSVTAAQAVNMTKRLTGMSALAKAYGADVQVVDVGIATPYACPDIIDKSIRQGTGNIAEGPAMTTGETLHAILSGVHFAKQAKAEQFDVIGVGEMGIGNTTTSSAVLAALTGKSAAETTGYGAGLTDDAYQNKIRVVERALSVNAPDQNDPVDILQKVGGLDIAAMCGAFLGAASSRIPAVIDGFISMVAALTAVRLNPSVRDFLFPSHRSEEQGFLIAANELCLSPYLHLQMRLGEGAGCPLAFPLLDAACTLMNDMASFDGAGIDDGYLDVLQTEDTSC